MLTTVAVTNGDRGCPLCRHIVPVFLGAFLYLIFRMVFVYGSTILSMQSILGVRQRWG